MDLGIIDRVGANAGQEVADADLVLMATPVGQMPEIMARIAPYLGAQTVVTDGGSTKADVVAAAQRIPLPEPRTVGQRRRAPIFIATRKWC